MKGFKAVFPKWFLVLLVIALLSGSIIPSTQAQDITPIEEDDSDVTVFNEYYSERYLTLDDGTEVTESIINGPSTPPLGQSEWIQSDNIQPEGIIQGFPSYNWVFGCTAVSAAMVAAYHDRTGYSNVYTGPTNGGVMPLNNVWGTWKDRTNATYPSNPLIASQNGVDGRTSRGSIDDYWVSSDSTAQDPFITGGWTEHTYGTAIGDYMRTSQSKFNNVDGATSIYNYSSGSAPLTCATMANQGLADGNLGRMRFYQQRGYEVTTCFNQRTDNAVSGGFSLAQFKAEIDAGHPVLIHVVGHTMVGYGYDGSTIFIRDTWDNDPSHTYTMPWGGYYQNMRMDSVSVLRLKQPTPPGNKKLLLPLVFKPQPPQPEYLIKNWNFEQGRMYWTEYSKNGYPTIYSTSSGLPSSLTPTSGSWASWLGGSYNEVSSISQQIKIKPQSRLTARIYIVSQETNCTNDYFYVLVNGAEHFKYGLCDDHETGGWGYLHVGLSAYANQTVIIKFEVRTNDSLNSNVFMDDVEWEITLHEDVEDTDIMEITPAIPALFVPESALPKEN